MSDSQNVDPDTPDQSQTGQSPAAKNADGDNLANQLEAAVDAKNSDSGQGKLASVDQNAGEKDKDQEPKKKESIGQTIKSLTILILSICAIRSVIIDWNDVPTGSMNPTILEGDRIVVNHLAYNLRVPFVHWEIYQWAKPERGDIVTFESPLDGKRNVKRVVGLPGDKLEVRNGKIYIENVDITYEAQPSGYEMRESYTEKGIGPDHTVQFEHERTAQIRRLLQDFNRWKSGEIRDEQVPANSALRQFSKSGDGPEDLSNFTYEGTIPEGYYFMMGDNRTNSKDSRASGYGAVPMKNIYGKAFGVAANFDFSKWEFKWDRYFTGLD